VQHAIALTQRPDAILLDLLMAGMSGWETAAVLKRHGDTCDMPVRATACVRRHRDCSRRRAVGVTWLQ